MAIHQVVIPLRQRRAAELKMNTPLFLNTAKPKSRSGISVACLRYSMPWLNKES